MKLFSYAAIVLAILFSSADAQEKREFGWKSNPRHAKMLRQISSVPGFGAPVPKTATVREWYYPTDQENIGACVFFSGGEAYDAAWKQKHGSWFVPSFLDLYQNGLKRDGNFPKDYGSYTSTVLWVLKNQGTLTAKTWPYVPSKLPISAPNTAKNTAERKAHMTVEAFDVPNDDRGRAVKHCIANLKIGVLAGGYWYRNGMTAKKDTKTGKWYIPMPSGRPVGGHEIVFISYDDTLWIDVNRNGLKEYAEIGWVEFKNHWGKDWGDGGNAWAPQRYMFNTSFFEDFGAIKVTK